MSSVATAPPVTDSPDAPERQTPTGFRGFLAQGQFWFAVLFVVGWTGIICGGLYFQFVLWEYPCPLCILQRMFMMLALLGPAHILRQALTGTVDRRDYMTGWGMALIGVMAGSFASWRQTMLHILPGDPGYGSAVFGIHLYVWAWILFQASIIGVGVMLTLSHRTTARTIPQTPLFRNVIRFALAFAALIILVNIVAVFFESGFHWLLPDDPDRYQLFYDLGILS